MLALPAPRTHLRTYTNCAAHLSKGRGSPVRLTALVVVAALLGACSAGTQSSGTLTPTTAASATPLTTTTPTVVPTPTETPPKDVMIESFSVDQGSLNVVLQNPNTDYGLVRARFSVAAVAKDGTVLEVVGNAGMPGSLASTIYQLPPGGEFYYSTFLTNASDAVDSLEFSLADQWLPWANVKPTAPELSGLSVANSYGFAVLRGRVSNPGDQTANIYIGASATVGGKLVVIEGAVDCVKAGEKRAFEVQGNPIAENAKVTLGKAVAYTTTVSGVGSVQAPPGC